jgi:hypothetical protein
MANVVTFVDPVTNDVYVATGSSFLLMAKADKTFTNINFSYTKTTVVLAVNAYGISKFGNDVFWFFSGTENAQ